RLNDSLGATSIVVTHDVAEALELVDYVYYMSAGKVEFQGTPDEVRAAGLSSLRLFVYGETDGPVQFHYPAPDYRQDLLAQCRRATPHSSARVEPRARPHGQRDRRAH